MEPPNAPLAPQVLLQHAGFVRALARRLLRDEHAAEDLAQEAWARWTVARPDERNVRGWFRAVLRNLAVNRGRGEGRRARREVFAARDEAVASPEEEHEHAELLRAVVEAVLALEEPYRGTILARYYQGLDPAEIARRSGASAGTVRSREHRALEKLRARLDRGHGGRERWAAVLARLAGAEAPAAAASASGATLALIAATAVLGVGVLAWRVTRATPPEPVRLARAAGVSVVATDDEEEHSSIAAPMAVREPQAATTEATKRSRASAEAGGPATEGSAEIRGRFVLPGGGPAAETSIRFHGWGDDRRASASWTDPPCEVAADGSFTVRFEPPPDFQFVLEAKAPGHAGASWRWSELGPGALVDLGEVELPVGGAVEGRIVDANGRVLEGERWTVHATTIGIGRAEGRDETRELALVTSGSFRIEDLWPGRIELSAQSPVANWTRGPAVTVVAGETTVADIVYSGPDNRTRITVVVFPEPFFVLPDEGQILATGPTGAVRAARKIPGSSQSFSFEGLEPGAYTLSIEDPRYLPWSHAGATPGESVKARLEGAAGLRLAVTDAAGAAVARYAVRVELLGVSFSLNEAEVHDGSAALESGVLRGLIPGDYALEIRDAEGLTGRAEVLDLRAGELRPVAVRIQSTGIVTGRVVDSAGVPVACGVQLLATAEVDDSDASPIRTPDAPWLDAADVRELAEASTAGADGRFRLQVPGAGTYVVRAVRSGTETFSDRLMLASGEGREELELVLPRLGGVRGRVVAPPGISCDGLRLWIAPEEICRELTSREASHPGTMLKYVAALRSSMDGSSALLPHDGAFELRGLPPGASRAFLVLDAAVSRGLHTAGGSVGGAAEVEAIEVPEGTLLDHDIVPADFPGSAEVFVSVHGEPAPGIELTLVCSAGFRITHATDAAGRTGPFPLLAGSWSVHLRDPYSTWSAAHPAPLVVESGRPASLRIDLDVVRASITCVDASSSPIAGEPITVLRSGDDSRWLPAGTHTTDARGRIELVLVPGEYAIARGEIRPWDEPAGVVPFTWTASGPLQERIRLGD